MTRTRHSSPIYTHPHTQDKIVDFFQQYLLYKNRKKKKQNVEPDAWL
jgi:hypothetical protein